MTGIVDAGWQTNATWRPEKINGRYQYRNPDEDPDGTGPQLAPPHPLLSGVYYVKLKRDESLQYSQEKGSGVVFVLTDNAASSAIVMQVADTTWQAYNFWGNKSLYYDKMDVDQTLDYREGTRAFKVSYNRPFDSALDVIGTESNMIAFLERNGYDVSYTTHVDVDRRYVEHGDAPAPDRCARRSKASQVGTRCTSPRGTTSIGRAST